MAARTVHRSRALVLGAAVCFGTTGTAQAFAPEEATPLTVGAIRLVLGAAILIAAAASAGRGAPAARTNLRASAPQLWWGAAGVAAYQPSFFLAVKLCGVGVGTVVALGSAPVVTGLLAWIVMGRLPGRRWFAGTALAVVGVVVLSGRLGAGGPSGVAFVAGIALAIAAATSYAVYTLAAKSALEGGADPSGTMARIFGVAALLLAPALVFGDASWIATPNGAAVAIWLGVVPTGLAYLLFAHGLRELGASEVATLTLAEPATAALLGALVLDEPMGVATLFGMGLIVSGLVLLALPYRGRTRPIPVVTGLP